MKEFFKYILATVVGMVVFCVIAIAIGAMSIVGMIASGESVKNIKDNSVLVINLSGNLNEQAEDNILGQLTGRTFNNIGLEETLKAIKKAETNDDIKGIYIESGALLSDIASVQELRRALANFKKSGKWIVAYADTYTQMAYYVSSVADKVYLNPNGELDWHGFGANPMYIKDLLGKFGVRMQVIKVGKYKSATETYTEDKMSDANRQQTQAYLNSLWANICKGVSESRKISIPKLNEYADNLITFDDPKVLIKKRMIDGILYTDQIKDEIKKLMKLKKDDDFNKVSIEDMQNVKEKTEGDQIAIYYAYGSIVSQPIEGGSPMDSEHMIVSKTVCKDLEELMDDDDVKAVVLRINSGGGSAYASEQIWHQVELLKKKKPVVVSMGGMAASGGYYMGCNSNWIVAEPTTLTGSIGIFGVIPEPSQLLTQKLGIKFDEVKTNRNSTMGTLSRPMNEEETAYLRNYIERGYTQFRKRVADGRKLSVEQVEMIAQGHVFTGEDALKIKLVDELGGIEKAVQKAAKLAKTNTYHTASYPAKPNVLTRFLEETTGRNYIDEQMRLVLGEYYAPFMMLKTINQTEAIQARLPFFMNIK